MKIRDSPLGFVVAAGILAFSCYSFSDREYSSRVEQEQNNQTTQPISETQSATDSEYITPVK